MNVGLTIVEGVANGASAYKSPSKRNIGLLGQFVRGASLKPMRITSLEDFNVIFGGQSSSFFGPGIVRSIFKEALTAPVTLYVARVTGTGAVAATGTGNLSGSKTMVVTAAYRGNEDTGTWANGQVVVNLYSFGSRIKDLFSLTVSYKGAVVETYNFDSLSEIQSVVNKQSKYIMVEFSGEIEKTSFTSLTGTITTTTSSNVITGTGTAFTTELSVGKVLFDNDGNQIGTVASITSATSLSLASKAMRSVSNASAKVRVDTTYTVTLAGGVDGTVVESDFYPVSSVSDPQGLACFEGFDVQILAVTEYHSISMARAMKAFLDNWASPIGVINLPLDADEGMAELYAQELQTNGRSFLAGAYMGWCKVPDDNGNAQLLPAIGPVLGAAYIRTPYVQGDFIHIPPGGEDSLFNYVTEVIPARLSQSVINKCVQQLSCNVIQYIENTGYYVGSSRTYSTNPLYCSVHIRLQTSYYVRALLQSMHFLEQKPNTPELRNQALTSLHAFFKTEYDNGALERSVDFDTAYQGICDSSNNPPTQDRKLINISVLWIPTECTESVEISLQRNDGILTASEA